jgi:methylase of polypeptide subunit release factors
VSHRTDALAALLAALAARNYHFITPTPATHARIVARANKQQARDLRDVFGWSLPFAEADIEPDILALMQAADVVEPSGPLLRSRVRVSSAQDALFLHSAFPTTQADAVFFGPDSYRFADFLQEALTALPAGGHLVDIGAGSGVGALTAARAMKAEHVTLTDINPAALELARANFMHAGLNNADFVEGDALGGVTRDINIIIANPPYIADPARRAYRDGGALHGGAISVRWAQAAAQRLQSRGVFVLYTGTAVVNGAHVLHAPLLEALGGFEVLYGEIDPDVFGEELEREDYADVERIAVIGVVAVKR